MYSTASRRAVLQALLDIDGDAYVAEIGRAAGFSTPTVAKILKDLLGKGWVVDRQEEPAPTRRLPRRYYRLTDQGAQAARAWLGRT